MLITRDLSARAERLLKVTLESSQPVRIGALHVTQTTPSRESEVATVPPGSVWITNGTNTNPTPWHTVTTNTGGAFGRVGIPSPPITEETNSMQLDSDVFNLPVDRLIDLWLAKYGNEWIDLVDLHGDNFYGLAYKRLKSLGELEVHYLTDRARYVCRKPK